MTRVSDATIVSVGCGGASTGSFIFGDVILVTAVCDYELGHHTDKSELEDPYAVTEMEETAVMNAAECFGLKDRVISLRVIVNMDTFLKGESPEQFWLGDSNFSSKAEEGTGETVDIFEQCHAEPV